MNSSTRILKETRALFWPWCGVMVAAAIKLLPSWSPLSASFIHNVSVMAFGVGIPLLATLSLGNEFQYSTLSLMLSQPIDRRKIWAEKSLVLIVALASAAFAYWFSWRSFFSDELQLGPIAGLAMISVCSGMFWTLMARSTIGGLVLNALQVVVIFVSVRAMYLFWTPTPVIGGAAVLSYAVLMIWLGRRMLLRLEVADGFAGDDLLTSSRKVMRLVWGNRPAGGVPIDLDGGPDARLAWGDRPAVGRPPAGGVPIDLDGGPDANRTGVAGWLRSRPTGAWLNVIRKEVRLLWPVWLLGLLAIGFLLCMTPFRFVAGPRNWGLEVASVVSFFALMLAAILSGALSLGEERMSGTHSWHLTIPFSVRKQWLIKLAVAVLSSLVCTAVVATLGQVLLGSYVQQVYGTRVLSSLLLGVSVLSVAAFWCASAVKGTVRAALLVFPALGVMLFAGGLAELLGQMLINGNGILEFTISRIHPYPFPDSADRFVHAVRFGRFTGFWPAAVLLVFALIQSYRLFRTEVRDSVVQVIRYLLAPAAAIFLCTVAQQMPVVVQYSANAHTWAVLGETSRAIDRLQLDPTKLDAARPLQLTLDDLARTVPLSDRVRRSLGTITVTPKTFTRRRWDGQNRRWISHDFAYFTTVRLRNDWSCSVYGTVPVIFSCTSPSGRWGYPAFP